MSDIGFEPFVQTEAARLEGLRLDAVQDRIDADLTTGRGAALVGELQRLVAAEPLRERLWAQLVLRVIRAGIGPVAITVGAGAVWVANGDDDSVSRIDPRTSSVTKAVSVGEQPAAIATGGGSVWVANSGDGSVSRIAPQTNHVIDTVSVGHSPQGVAVAGDDRPALTG